jgi:D-tagatose-1,6-bisphosphate aldolase subunit GatZ/KbaZ
MQVGTDLHTTDFDPGLASRLRHIAALKGSLLKGHYTNWVGVPEDYSASGMGGANVRPEFTVEEADALRVLCGYEDMLVRSRSIASSGFLGTLTTAVLDSGRWRKWLRPDEPVDFAAVAAERQRWLVASGARYVGTDPGATVAELREHFGVSDATLRRDLIQLSTNRGT